MKLPSPHQHPHYLKLDKLYANYRTLIRCSRPRTNGYILSWAALERKSDVNDASAFPVPDLILYAPGFVTFALMAGRRFHTEAIKIHGISSSLENEHFALPAKEYLSLYITNHGMLLG